ncbi:hypothetical protein ACGFNU_44325 [Spirillospora sp. NPDC048911]|uniref:hypothetical protein n=1 Tax=Spirillospora sp. NPDC048911 TaxID=3364527 RepID=UPI003710BA50
MPEIGTRHSAPQARTHPRLPARSDLDRRRAHLLRLHHELGQLGARARVQRPRNGRWRLKLRQARWTETVLCAGAEDTFAYVTGNGRVLGPTHDVRYVAQVLVWMIEGKHR